MIDMRNIFVVDDDPIFRLITKKLFEKNFENLNVEFYENGEKGINEIKKRIENGQRLPAAILLDIEMPALNGWGFMEQFIKAPDEFKSNIDVYIVTSSIAPEDKAKAASFAEIKDYVNKPLNLDMLKRIVGLNEA